MPELHRLVPLLVAGGTAVLARLGLVLALLLVPLLVAQLGWRGWGCWGWRRCWWRC